MTEKIRKVLSFPSPVPAKADYQRVKSSYSVREIKQLFGLSERTVRRWTEAGIIQGTPVGESGDFTYDFQALTLFRRVREMRTQGLTIKQIEAELQGQMSLFRPEGGQVSRLLTPFEEALLLHEQGDEKAAEFYLQAINEGDNVAEAYCNLGIIELDRGKTIGALENFTQVSALGHIVFGDQDGHGVDDSSKGLLHVMWLATASPAALPPQTTWKRWCQNP